MSRSCSGESLNLVRLIGGIETYRTTKDGGAQRFSLDKRESVSAEVALEDRTGVAAEPVVDDRGVHGSEVGLVMNVAGVVLEGWVPRIRVENRRRAVQEIGRASCRERCEELVVG